MKFYATVGLLLAVIFGAGARYANADIVISDGDFLPANWTYGTQYRGTNSGTVTRMTTGGNPGSYLKISQTTGGFGTLNFRTALFATTYDPQISGAISSIDFDIDRFTPYTQFGGSTFLRPILEQNGQLYGTPDHVWWYSSSKGAPTQWTAQPLHDLVASDFGAFLGLGTGLWHGDAWRGASPDFSASGGVIRFGFVTEVGAASGGQRVDTAVDNFRVSVVPEPSTLGLLGIGLAGMVVFVGRRHLLHPKVVLGGLLRTQQER